MGHARGYWWYSKGPRAFDGDSAAKVRANEMPEVEEPSESSMRALGCTHASFLFGIRPSLQRCDGRCSVTCSTNGPGYLQRPGRKRRHRRILFHKMPPGWLEHVSWTCVPPRMPFETANFEQIYFECYDGLIRLRSQIQKNQILQMFQIRRLTRILMNPRVHRFAAL